MSYLYWSSPDGCVGGLGFFLYFDSFDDIPVSEFYDDIFDFMLFDPDFIFDLTEVNL